jgi:hypothetical protein
MDIARGGGEYLCHPWILYESQTVSKWAGLFICFTKKAIDNAVSLRGTFENRFWGLTQEMLVTTGHPYLGVLQPQIKTTLDQKQ